jgi:hypothetical protein
MKGDQATAAPGREGASSSAFYFAYGSNLLFARLHARTPSIENLGMGKLMNHRLSFTKPGGDGSGKCGIEKVDGEDHVLGVIYRMDRSEKAILDRIEGVGHGYRDHAARVQGQTGMIDVFTYYPARLDCELLPYDWYKQFVLAGAVQNRFPAYYIELIESVQVSVDPDVKRRKINLDISAQAETG